jgi:hypothetical protein
LKTNESTLETVKRKLKKRKAKLDRVRKELEKM